MQFKGISRHLDVSVDGERALPWTRMYRVWEERDWNPFDSGTRSLEEGDKEGFPHNTLRGVTMAC